MAKPNGKQDTSSIRDIGSPAFMAQFRKDAKSFTTKATVSKAAALDVLRREGIVTASGKLKSPYKVR
jgi:hypothetical protein